MSLDPSFFAAASAARHRCRISDGSEVELPLQTYDAEIMSAFFTVSARKARALLPSDELRLCRLTPGRALFAVHVMDYKSKNIDLYQEFVTSLLVHRSRLLDWPLLSALALERLPGVGAYLTHIAVTQDQARRIGWDLLGFPKFRADIRIADEGARMQGEVRRDGRRIFSLCTRKPDSYKERQRSFQSYSLDPDSGRLFRVPYQYWADIGFRFGGEAAELSLGDHEIAAEIGDLELSAKPLFSLHARHYALISNPPAERLDVGNWQDPRALYREVRELRQGRRHAPDYTVPTAASRKDSVTAA